MALVLPGDIVHSAAHPLGSYAGTPAGVLRPDAHIRLGPGILPERVAAAGSSASDVPTLVATRAGVLGHVPSRTAASSGGVSGAERSSKRAKIEEGSGAGGRGKAAQQDGLWVETNTRRYTPAPSDTVIGQITARGPDFYTISLHSSQPAALPVLAFEGATKRHRPNIRVGALVYARVVSAERHTDPELSCVNPVTGKADGLGELKVAEREAGCAMLFRISLGLASSLLHPSHPLLPRLAAHFPFESAIGHNGLLWARTAQASHLVALGRILERAEQVGHVWAPKAAKKEEEEEEGMDVDVEKEEEGAEVYDEGGPEALASRAQDVARLRGALRPDEIKRIVTTFL